MSILNFLRKKKKHGSAARLSIPEDNSAKGLHSAESERGILINMGDIVIEPDADHLLPHKPKPTGIPVYTPEIYRDDIIPELTMLVDTSALQTDGLAAAAGDRSNDCRDEDFNPNNERSAAPGQLSSSGQFTGIPAFSERKRRYGGQEAGAADRKPDPFNDGIIIIGEWEHTEPGGIIGFDPGMKAACAGMSERSSPLLIIDRSVDLTLQSVKQAASVEKESSGEAEIQQVRRISADEYTLSAEEFETLSNYEIINKLLAKWWKLDTAHLGDIDKYVGSSSPEEMDRLIQELRENILYNCQGEDFLTGIQQGEEFG